MAAPPQSSSATASDLWFAYDGGAYVRRAGSTTWTKLTGVAAATCISFGKASTPTGYTVFIHGRIGSVRGVYRSDDACTTASPTWTYYGTPTTNVVTALSGDRESFGEVYLGTGGRGLFRYTP
jgi:xyloglucan-specific exo-beta-1,4-glucanase